MKNQLIDRFSKVGRLESRLREIVAKAENREITSMDAGDMVGRQIVAFVEAQANPSPEFQELHLEAELARGILYQRSNGATPLEAAESLAEAHRLMLEQGKGQETLDRLFDSTWKNYTDLVEIGSRRTSWTSLKILFTVVENTESHRSHRADVVDAFAALAEEFDEDCEIDGAIAAVMKIAKWARVEAPESFARLLTCMPQLLEIELAEIDTDVALQAFLFGAKNDAELEVETYERLVRRLIEDGRRDTEVRLVYRAFLEHHPERHSKVDAAFRRLAHVHPDPNFSFDPDLDALNQICCEVFGVVAIWPWRNRALMLRRKLDFVGAVSCLAKAMNITGEPPDLVGLLAPVLHKMGFRRSAKEFGRFAPAAERQRFRLRTLDLLEAQPLTDRGAKKLIAVLEKALIEPVLPPEFKPGLNQRIADLLQETGCTEEALTRFRALLDDEPNNEVAAVRIAEIEANCGRIGKARAQISGDLSDRVAPWVKFVESKIAEFEEDFALAQRCVDQALEALPLAEEAGRDHCQKAYYSLEQRIRDDHGDEVANGALLAMLQTDCHHAVHEDLASLRPKLEQRSLDLSLRSGDLEQAKKAIDAISDRDPNDHEFLTQGLAAAINQENQQEASFFLEQISALNLEESAELSFLRGLHAAHWGDAAEARQAFELAVESGHGPTAVLALASMKAEEGEEDAALELLENFGSSCAGDEESKKQPESQLRKIAQLHGILLERAGRCTEARIAYLEASRRGDGWHEARRRAGLLSLKEGLSNSDPKLMQDAVSCLEGFRDSESIIAETWARASVAKTPHDAAELLGTAIKRVDSRHHQLLETLRLPCLIESGDFDTAEAIAQKLSNECKSETSDENRVADILSWLQRRRIVDSLTFMDPAQTDEVMGVATELSQTADLAEAAGLDEAVAILNQLADPKAPIAQLGDDCPPELVLAASIVCGLATLPDETRKRLDELAECDVHPELAELSRYRLAVECHERKGLNFEAASKAALRLGSGLPFSEASIQRLVGIRAITNGDRATLEQVLASGVEGLDDLITCLELSELCSRDGGVDTTRLTRGLARLSKATGNPAFSQALQRTQKIIASTRETPSPAWASARLRTAGKRARVFLPAVLKFWEKQSEAQNCDPECLHQVALLRIAAAHEAEAAGREDEKPWLDAHAAWHRLLECESYWDLLKERLDEVGVESARGKIAKWIVFAHLKRAQFFLGAGKMAHAMRHARYATRSPLAKAAGRQAMNERVFAIFAGDFERQLQKKHFSEALQCLDRVLLADDHNAHAEREMIRVAAEGLRQPFGMLDALRKEPDEFTRSELAQFMQSLLTYAERGMDRVEQREEIDSLLAEDLSICLRGRAFLLVHEKLDHEGAAKLLDRALELLPASSRSAKTVRNQRASLSVVMASDAIEKGSRAADGNEPYAKALSDVDSVLAEDAGNRDLLREKARLLLAQGKAKEAEALARELFESAQTTRDAEEIRVSIELLNEVQRGHEVSQLHGQLGAVEMLIQDRNWRSALELFKDAVVGHESEGPFIAKHIQILLGLHKVRKVEEALPALEGFLELKEEARLFTAQLQCLKHMSALGGDIYSAFELYERKQYKKSMNILLGLASADTQELGAQFLTAVCQFHLNGETESHEVCRRVDQQARIVEEFWICELLRTERGQ